MFTMCAILVLLWCILQPKKARLEPCVGERKRKKMARVRLYSFCISVPSNQKLFFRASVMILLFFLLH